MATPLIRNDLFGLTHTPFATDPKTPFLDEGRQRHLIKLIEQCQRRGFAAIAGESGTGKTTLARYHTADLHQQSHKIIYVPFVNQSDTDLLKTLCQQLDCIPPHNKRKVIDTIQQRIREIQPVNPVIVFDEMQNATPSAMDTIRLLANDNFDSGSKITCILIGTNEFFAKLRLAINESLRQRITLFCQLRQLDRTAVGNYIEHCLSHVGAEHQIFAPAAIQLIFELSGGSIRLVKQLAINAMTVASAVESANVSLDHVQQAAEYTLLPLHQLDR